MSRNGCSISKRQSIIRHPRRKEDMKAEQAKQLTIGEPVEIRYEGQNLGLVRYGKVKNVYHDGSCVDILLTSGGYGIKFGVPCSIVHRAESAEPAEIREQEGGAGGHDTPSRVATNDINITQHQVWCELHNGFVEVWEARYVHQDNMRKQRPARGNTLTVYEYGACVDCLAEEMHPLPLEER